MCPYHDIIFYLQDVGRRVLSSLFPRKVKAKLSGVRVLHNKNTVEDLRSGKAFSYRTWLELVTGSRPEGLAMADGTGYDEADMDNMYLHGGVWGVEMPSEDGDGAKAEPEKPYLVVNGESCPPGFTRVQIIGDVTAMADKLGRWIQRGAPEDGLSIAGVRPDEFWQATGVLGAVVSKMHGRIGRQIYGLLNRERAYSGLTRLREKLPDELETLVSRWTINSREAHQSFVERDGETFLSSSKVLSLLSDSQQPRLHQGPSQQVRDTDLVPALVCSAPFPCVTQYLTRQCHENWPKPEALTEIAALPGIIVPTGRKGSEERDLQWRYSFSPQELRLAQDMPTWVKSGYRAFKYTLKAILRMSREPKPPSETDGRSTVCSFHMKTILLWTLEQPFVWQQECPFRVMILLLFTLDSFLGWGKLPHYFNPDCDLFDAVSEEEVQFSRACIEGILRDPVASIISSPSKQREVAEKLTQLLQGQW